MKKYRCMLEVFEDVDAENEEDAVINALVKLVDNFEAGTTNFICWEIENEK